MNQPVFIPDAQLREKIVRIGFLKKFHEDDLILREDINIGAIPIVTRGSIKVMSVHRGHRENLLYYIHPGENCLTPFPGGMHNDEKDTVKVIAGEETEIGFIPIEKIGMLIQGHSEWFTYVFQWLDYTFQQYHIHFEEIFDVVNSVAFKKTGRRLADLLQK